MEPIQNIVHGELRPVAATREAGPWTVPVTPAHDTALALKCVRRPSAGCDIARAITVLSAIGRAGTWIGPDDLKTIAARTGSPIAFLAESVAKANRWLASSEDYVARFGAIDDSGRLTDGRVRYASGGATALMLSGDDILVPPWKLGHAVLAGGNTIVKPSNIEPLTTFLFVKALVAHGLRTVHLLHFDTLASGNEPDLEALRRIVQHCDQSVVFGNAAVFEGMPFLTHHRSIRYSSGHSAALVYPDADLRLGARAILRAAVADRGNRCFCTKKVFAARAVAAELEACLVAEAEALRRGDPLDEAAETGRPHPDVRTHALAAATDAQILYDRDVLMARCDDSSRLLAEEIPYPILGIHHADPGELVARANKAVERAPTGRCFAASVFTRDPGTYHAVTGQLRAHKVLPNLPTSDLECGHSHEGKHLFLELLHPTEVAAF